MAHSTDCRRCSIFCWWQFASLFCWDFIPPPCLQQFPLLMIGWNSLIYNIFKKIRQICYNNADQKQTQNIAASLLGQIHAHTPLVAWEGILLPCPYFLKDMSLGSNTCQHSRLVRKNSSVIYSVLLCQPLSAVKETMHSGDISHILNKPCWVGTFHTPVRSRLSDT